MHTIYMHMHMYISLYRGDVPTCLGIIGVLFWSQFSFISIYGTQTFYRNNPPPIYFPTLPPTNALNTHGEAPSIYPVSLYVSLVYLSVSASASVCFTSIRHSISPFDGTGILKRKLPLLLMMERRVYAPPPSPSLPPHLPFPPAPRLVTRLLSISYVSLSMYISYISVGRRRRRRRRGGGSHWSL